MKFSAFFCCLLSISPLLAQNKIPVLSNVQWSVGPGSLLTLDYDLEDPDDPSVSVQFRATEKGGSIFDYDTGNAVGDVGSSVVPGNGKQIQWDFSAYTAQGMDFRLMLVADDGHPVDIQALVDQADSVRMKNDMSFLEGIRHRNTGLAHLQDTRDYIRSVFEEYQLETYLQEFPYGSYQAANIIGRKIGVTEENQVYILDGHFDSVSNSPGADDNASAVTGVLEALRLIAPYSFEKSIRFIGFDLEESGLVGSIRYVQDGIWPGENIQGVFNYEMIGYYSEIPNSQSTPAGFSLLFPDVYAELQANAFKGNFINAIGLESSLPMMNSFENAAATYVTDLYILPIKAPATWQVLTPDLGRSDHAPFWSAGIPAIMLTDGAEFRNPNYHTPNDQSDVLNFTFMRQIVQASVATIAELAGIRHASTWWSDVQLSTPVKETGPCHFSIFPNPADDLVRIAWPSCKTGTIYIELLDITGTRIRAGLYQAGQVANRQLWDVHSLEPGVYFVKITYKNTQWVEKLLIH